MEQQFKSYRTTTSLSAISSLPFNRIRVVDPKTDEDWTEKLVEMSRIEAEKSKLEEQALQAERDLKAKDGIWPYAESFTYDASEEDEELGGMEVDINNNFSMKSKFSPHSLLGGMEVDINNNFSMQSKKRMSGRELLATGAVTSHIPEVERFPTEGNILILLIPRETSLQTIEEALSAMLDEVNLNTVQRLCLLCFATKSPSCRFCDLQSRRPVPETTSSASSSTAKSSSIRVSDPNTKEDLTEHFAEMRERREREAEESKIAQLMKAAENEYMKALAAREISTEFFPGELRSQRARQDEFLRQEKRERQLRRVKKNGIKKKKSRTYVLLMSSMYGKWTLMDNECVTW